MVSLRSPVNLITWWSEEMCGPEGMRQLGLVIQFPASSDAEEDFCRSRLPQKDCFHTLRCSGITASPVFKTCLQRRSARQRNVNTSLCYGVMQLVFYGMGWEGRGPFTQGWHCHTTAPLFCFVFSPLCPPIGQIQRWLQTLWAAGQIPGKAPGSVQW